MIFPIQERFLLSFLFIKLKYKKEMIQTGTILKIVDNSGAVKGRCIRILGNKKNASLGDRVIISVQNAQPKRRISEGSIQQGIIVQTKKDIRYLDGSRLKQGSNSIILVNAQNNPMGNRVSAPIILFPKENTKTSGYT